MSNGHKQKMGKIGPAKKCRKVSSQEEIIMASMRKDSKRSKIKKILTQRDNLTLKYKRKFIPLK